MFLASPHEALDATAEKPNPNRDKVKHEQDNKRIDKSRTQVLNEAIPDIPAPAVEPIHHMIGAIPRAEQDTLFTGASDRIHCSRSEQDDSCCHQTANLQKHCNPEGPLLISKMRGISGGFAIGNKICDEQSQHGQKKPKNKTCQQHIYKKNKFMFFHSRDYSTGGGRCAGLV